MSGHRLGLMLLVLGGCTAEPALIVDVPLAARLDAVLGRAVDSGDVPGVVGLITTRDSVVYRAAFGTMDADHTVPMRDDAVFRIASMTKPVTSVGLMMLVEEGLLTLDDAAETYLPELTDRQVVEAIDTASGSVSLRPAARPITIRDLLRHTSGIGYTFSSAEWWQLFSYTSYYDFPDRNLPLAHDPGARWTYGMSTAQLGWIIEEVTGLPLDDFFAQRIFAPLGMEETSFHLPASQGDRLVATHRMIGGELVGLSPPDSVRGNVRGDGGLLSTADDYARFVRMILGGGELEGQRLLEASTVAEMARDQLEGITVVEQPSMIPNTSAAFPLGAGVDGFGLGFQVSVGETPGSRPPGSLSWAGIQNTHFWIDRQNGLGVILLMQQLPFYDERVLRVLVEFERALYEAAR